MLEQLLERIANALESIAVMIQKEVASPAETAEDPTPQKIASEQKPKETEKPKEKKTAKKKKDPIDDELGEEKAVTKEQMVDVIRLKVKEIGKAPVVDLLKKYGYKVNTAEINPKDYAAVVKNLNDMKKE